MPILSSLLWLAAGLGAGYAINKASELLTDRKVRKAFIESMTVMQGVHLKTESEKSEALKVAKKHLQTARDLSGANQLWLLSAFDALFLALEEKWEEAITEIDRAISQEEGGDKKRLDFLDSVRQAITDARDGLIGGVSNLIQSLVQFFSVD